MLTMIRLAVVLIALLAIVQFAGASEGAVVGDSSVSASALSLEDAPVLLAQSSDSSSSSGSYRIPRGLIRLAIFGVIALFGAGAWVVRKLSGE